MCTCMFHAIKVMFNKLIPTKFNHWLTGSVEGGFQK